MITCFTRWCFHFLFSTPKIGEDEQFDLRFYVFIQKVASALKPPTSLPVDSWPFQQTEALIFFGTPSGPSPKWLRIFSGEKCNSKWTIDSPKGVPPLSLGGWRLHNMGYVFVFSWESTWINLVSESFLSWYRYLQSKRTWWMTQIVYCRNWTFLKQLSKTSLKKVVGGKKGN